MGTYKKQSSSEKTDMRDDTPRTSGEAKQIDGKTESKPVDPPLVASKPPIKDMNGNVTPLTSPHP